MAKLDQMENFTYNECATIAEQAAEKAVTKVVSALNIDNCIGAVLGKEEEMPIQRAKVKVGDSKYVWVSAKDMDTLNDRIVEVYVEHGRIWEFLDKSGGYIKKESKRKIPTLREYTESWIKMYKEKTLRPTTLNGYRTILRSHVYPYFGEMRLDEIETADIQTFLNEKMELSKKYLTEMVNLLSEIFKDAMEDKIVEEDPTASRRLVIPSDKVTIREALDMDDFRSILMSLQILKEEEDKKMIALMMLTGMRRGEVLGLKWEDIDFETGIIHVRRNVTYANNQPHIGETKTAKGVRDIPLVPILKEMLEPLGSEGYIIGGKEPISHMSYLRRFERIKKQIDLHGATAHIFRHSYITFAACNGVDIKTLQSIAGHADATVTLNRYSHVQKEKLSDAGKVISGIFLQELQTTKAM